MTSALHCPFNTERYALGLRGVPEPSAGGRVIVLRRPIDGTPLCDGVGPWPYLWISADDDIRALQEEFRHLVTVMAVTQPGYAPKGSLGDPVLLKQHFVYDPGRPPPPLSRRARQRLSRCEDRGEFCCVTDGEKRLRMADIHARLVARRGLERSYIDFPRKHFEAIAALESGVFFEVRDALGCGAMACGVLFGNMLQILHMASTDHGLGWNASYLLMAGLQRTAKELDVRLLTGGMPNSGSEGLKLFKERWANHMEPVYMLRIINDAGTYASLCAGRWRDSRYFPAYRDAEHSHQEPLAEAPCVPPAGGEG